jgi:membrane protein
MEKNWPSIPAAQSNFSVCRQRTRRQNKIGRGAGCGIGFCLSVARPASTVFPSNWSLGLSQKSPHTTFLETLGAVFKQAASGWVNDNAPRLGAALAFYTLFSLAPVLVVVVSLTALVFGPRVAHADLAHQSQALIGVQGAAAIRSIIQSATNRPALGWFATTLGALTILIGVSGAFNELQDGLNLIWKVDVSKRSFWTFSIIQRLWSFLLVAATGLLALTFMIASAGLSLAEKLIGDTLPASIFVWELVNVTASFCMLTIMFALVFKFIPETKIAWFDVWPAAAFTSISFTAGKVAIGFYLGHSALASVYGAAASLVIFLIWVYFSAQILLFGAELSHAYARNFGSRKLES